MNVVELDPKAKKDTERKDSMLEVLEEIKALEDAIDAMTSELKPMTHFILPGGHPLISHTHITRCVCRRAERCCVRLELESLEVDPVILKYLNRLSDYMFVLGRYIGAQLKVEENIWKPRV